MLFIESILGGLAVGLGTLAFISINEGTLFSNVVGAFCYGIILLAIQFFELDLFVGRSGLMNNKRTDPIELILIYIGNFVGVTWIALMLQLIPQYMDKWDHISQSLLQSLNQQGWGATLVLSIFCGMMMYAGIISFQESNIWVYFVSTMMICMLAQWPFIHVIYFCLWIDGWQYWYLIIPVTIGNFIGANIWGLLRRHSSRFKHALPEYRQDQTDEIISKLHDISSKSKKSQKSSDEEN